MSADTSGAELPMYMSSVVVTFTMMAPSLNMCHVCWLPPGPGDVFCGDVETYMVSCGGSICVWSASRCGCPQVFADKNTVFVACLGIRSLFSTAAAAVSPLL